MNERAPASERDTGPIDLNLIRIKRMRAELSRRAVGSGVDIARTTVIPVRAEGVNTGVPRERTWEEERELAASEVFAKTKNRPIPEWAKLRK